MYLVLGILLFILPCPAFSQAPLLRSFDELFPGLGEENRSRAFSNDGLINVLQKDEALGLVPVLGHGIDFESIILESKPAYCMESLIVIPHPQRNYDILDAYNALGRIRALEGIGYRSSRRGDVPLFEEATRIESIQSNNPIPDPPPAREVPSSETLYVRLRDPNFGNSFYRGTISLTQNGLIYDLINVRGLSVLFFTVVRREGFYALMYAEPLAEGMLFYILAGADVSNFVASLIDVPSTIANRGRVFFTWVVDGLNAFR